MTSRFFKKTALLTLVIALCLCCVFFACACEDAAVTVDFSVTGEIVGGASLPLEVTFAGDKEKVAACENAECVFEVVLGTAFAEVKDGKLLISEDVKKGDGFSVRLTVNGLSVTKEFVVAAAKPLSLESVTLFCPESAAAGERVDLSSVVKPAGINALVVYSVVSGDATVEGNVLTVSPSADGGEIVVKASFEDKSDQKTIRISTVQTRELYISLSDDRALPGSEVPFVITKIPAESTYPVTYTVQNEYAEVDAAHSLILLKEDAPMRAEVVVTARSGSAEATARITLDYPVAEDISARGGIVIPGADRTIDFSLYPAAANRSAVVVSLLEGGENVEWHGGTSFRVTDDAAQNAEITFLLTANDDVFTAVTYTVGQKTLTSLSISTTSPTSYLASGASVTFSHTTVPAGAAQAVHYRATAGADLVVINGNVVTVKDGADIGEVTVVAESEDGTVSNEVNLTVSGRYSRRVYSSWANVTFSSGGENSCVWMVLPSTLNAGCLTVLVPYEITDLVIQGRYDGTDETAYKDLYFYFRNTSERTVTLWNFATIATQGLGGTVFDLGSSGETEIILKGQNLIRADSPFFIDNSGEETDGVWKPAGYSDGSAQQAARRSGKPGYRGTAGGTAVSGYALTFRGDGTLTAQAGSGVNGTAGGNGADAVYDGSLAYLSGSGGNGGNGGDSGAAIYAYRASFLSGFVTAIPGNAGKGGAGGKAGSIEALAGYDVTKAAGTAGANGEDGAAYGAVKAKTVVGNRYLSSVGEVKSSSTLYVGTLADLTDRLSRFYGVSVLYGNKLYNPYKNKSKSNRYLMEEQTDADALMLQTNFLMYTMSVMPKNCWNEVTYRTGTKVTIYLCKSITSGTGSTILGLTSDKNNVWFATFGTDLRGVFYSGYFNIMLHEFTHVFHYQFSASGRSAFEAGLKSYNYGLDYKTSYGSNDRVYGMSASNTEANSCFFTAYSRKTVMEDASETVSIACTFSSQTTPLVKGTNLYNKFMYLAESFSRDYETLSPFVTGKVLFADRRLAA